MAEARAAAVSSPGFRAVEASGPDWSTTVKAAWGALDPLPARANFGVLYATDALAGDLSSILTFLRERTGIAHWVGTVGLGVAASGREHYDGPALSILVGALPEDGFRIFAPVEDEGLSRFHAAHAAWIDRHKPILGLVHGDPRNRRLAVLIEELARDSGAFLVGGLSAAQGPDFPQVADGIGEGGVSGVLFASRQLVVTGLSQGCSPIGPQRLVGRCRGNVIMEIDGRPALDVLREDIGELLARDLSRIGGYIFAGFPIAGSDTGDYLVRNLIALDLDKGWISVGEPVEEDRAIMFCRRDHDSARTDLDRMLDDVIRRAGDNAKAAVYVSCVARGRHLFGPDSAELAVLRERLGDLPLVGFFANGEICNNRLYGYTGVLTLFL